MDEAFGNTECHLVVLTVNPVFYESLLLLRSSIGFSCYFSSKFFCFFEDGVEGEKKNQLWSLSCCQSLLCEVIPSCIKSTSHVKKENQQSNAWLESWDAICVYWNSPSKLYAHKAVGAARAVSRLHSEIIGQNASARRAFCQDRPKCGWLYGLLHMNGWHCVIQ